ncbi:hypothetical protein BRC2024_OQYPJBKP_CDS_0039 [Acinetobacter phage vB_AbaM_Highwayman]
MSCINLVVSCQFTSSKLINFLYRARVASCG